MKQDVLTEAIFEDVEVKDRDDRSRDFRIIDSHLHLGNLPNLNFPGGTDKQIIDLLKQSGVEKAIFSHHGALSTFKSGLKKTMDVLERYKDFLLAYNVYNPNFGEESLNAIKSLKDDKSFVGIKIHPSWHSCYPYDGKYEKFWEYADRNGLIVLTHSWNPHVPNRAQKYSDPFFFEKIIKKYRDVRLILAHAGGRGEYLYKVIDLLERHENLYVDFAGDIFTPGLIEEYVMRIGSERLLFGTDMPWIDVRFYISDLLASKISNGDKANIFGLNAIRLFNI
jgi:predicted TIM-barrel fold metal-dependent hydrolase